MRGRCGDLIQTRSAGRVKGNVESVTRNEVVISQDGVSKTLPVDDVAANYIRS